MHSFTSTHRQSAAPLALLLAALFASTAAAQINGNREYVITNNTSTDPGVYSTSPAGGDPQSCAGTLQVRCPANAAWTDVAPGAQQHRIACAIGDPGVDYRDSGDQSTADNLAWQCEASAMRNAVESQQNVTITGTLSVCGSSELSVSYECEYDCSGYNCVDLAD